MATKITATSTLGVTIAFTLGAIAIAGTVYVLSAAGLDSGFAKGIKSWPLAAAVFVGNSMFAGLIVDGLRLALDHFWPAALQPGANSRRI